MDVELKNRIHHLDFIRGIAVLGILAMNIVAFALPFSAYANPYSFGDFSGANFYAWLVGHLVFDLKFMAIFSMLFGVGIAIFCQRAEAKHLASEKLHYRRMTWLFVFGLIHAYLIWWGDILVAYALAGSLTVLMRNISNRAMLWSAAGLMLFYSLFMLLQALMFPFLSEQDIQQSILPFWLPEASVLSEEVAAYQGNWSTALAYRVEQTLSIQPYLLFYLPRIIALNLIGILLYRSGFFAGRWKSSVYALCATAGVLLGLAVTAYGANLNLSHQFDWRFSMADGMQFNYWGSLLSAFGYLALLMLISQSFKGFLHETFCRVGRMAFTNYIAQSILATLFFYGFGFGYFATLERAELWWVVGSIWLIIMIFSWCWLSFFKQGPLELCWRLLTYGVNR